jgi:hypothetical protein
VEQGGTIGNGHGRRNRGILQGRPADFLQLIFPSIDNEADAQACVDKVALR